MNIVTQGGKPSKGTPADKRLKGNPPTGMPPKGMPPKGMPMPTMPAQKK